MPLYGQSYPSSRTRQTYGFNDDDELSDEEYYNAARARQEDWQYGMNPDEAGVLDPLTGYKLRMPGAGYTPKHLYDEVPQEQYNPATDIYVGMSNPQRTPTGYQSYDPQARVSRQLEMPGQISPMYAQKQREFEGMKAAKGMTGTGTKLTPQERTQQEMMTMINRAAAEGAFDKTETVNGVATRVFDYDKFSETVERARQGLPLQPTPEEQGAQAGRSISGAIGGFLGGLGQPRGNGNGVPLTPDRLVTQPRDEDTTFTAPMQTRGEQQAQAQGGGITESDISEGMRRRPDLTREQVIQKLRKYLR